jgi:hypothetical protein
MLAGSEPYEIRETDGNTGTNVGIVHAIAMMVGVDASNPWSNALSFIGVGDTVIGDSATATEPGKSSTSATAIDYHQMTTAYPTVTDRTFTYRSTFGATEANFAWNSFVVHNATYATDATGVPLIRKASVQGTKAPGQAWQISCAITMA